MATINFDYYNGTDVYNDGSVEEELLDHYKNNKNIDFNRNDIFYLTTDIRTNILNWYPFTKTDSVLEIGCGCGTITEMLCNNCKFVTSVEGSKRRAEITYYRHIDKDNLEIYAGNFENIKFDKKFDYIVLIGVLEYAKIFFNDDKPFDKFLKMIGSLLKDSGKVLVAIENRYGIKYWAGANEDHLIRPFIGLEGYDNQSVQTFGKQELINLIERCGFTKYKFYYPFPDYKISSVVYSDERLPNYSEIFDVPIYTYGNVVNFDIHKVLYGLISNKQFGFFSNSFLVEFGQDKADLSDVIYAKNSLIRNDEYQIITLQDIKGDYYKIPCSAASACHLNKMVTIYQKMTELNIDSARVEKCCKGCKIEEIHGVNEAEHLKDLMKIHNVKHLASDKAYQVSHVNNSEYFRSAHKDVVNDAFLSELDRLVDFYRSISVKKNIENPIIEELRDIYKSATYILKLSIIDGNVSNLIKTENGKYVFIDQEWTDENELPTDYLILMSILYIFKIQGESIGNYVTIDSILNKYNITKEKKDVLLDLEKYFYYKKNKVINLIKRNKIDGLKILKIKNQLETNSCVYYDIGNGFNENDKIIGTYNFDNNSNIYKVTFNLPKNVNLLRFDPVLVGGQLLYFDDLKINGNIIQYDNWNIFKYKEKSTLIYDHPYITFTTDEQSIEITLKLHKLSKKEIKIIMSQILKNFK